MLPGVFANRAAYPLPLLVLLDLKLPVKSGFEVLAWIRRQPQFQQLPVVICSSSGVEFDQQKAFSLWAADYLVKPSGLTQTKELSSLIQKRWFTEE